MFTDNLRDDVAYVCAALEILTWSGPAAASQFLSAFEGGATFLAPPSRLYPPVVCCSGVDVSFVLIAGSQDARQLLLNFLGSVQSPIPPYPGSVNSYPALIASAIAAPVRSFLAPLASGQQLVLAGHSLGAAVAQLLCFQLSTLPWGSIEIIALGGPRVGDPIFAASLPAATYRVSTYLDPVPNWPPELWASLGSIPPLSGPAPYSVYQHGGQCYGLSTSGQLGLCPFPLSSILLLYLFPFSTIPYHLISTYSSYLNTPRGLDISNVASNPSVVSAALAEIIPSARERSSVSYCAGCFPVSDVSVPPTP